LHVDDSGSSIATQIRDFVGICYVCTQTRFVRLLWLLADNTAAVLVVHCWAFQRSANSLLVYTAVFVVFRGKGIMILNVFHFLWHQTGIIIQRNLFSLPYLGPFRLFN